jgi:uncharacterized protein
MSAPARAQLVVIAISGRALAQSAVRGGWRVQVLDAFADRDTRAAGEAVCVAREDAIALDYRRMFAALGEPSERIIVTGSGFERAPQVLSRLAAYGALCANDADIVCALKEPELSTELLRALGFTVPGVQSVAPQDPLGWLQKEIGGAGGVHVRPAAGAPHRARRYYQRIVPGRPLSVTFLADGERAYIIGFNAQSFCAIGAAPYCYVGASTCAVPGALASELQARLDRLVRVSGLRGLNGLDFLLDGSDVCTLEVNPRPTATFELYDEEIANGLVYWHVRSFRSPVPEFASLLQQRSQAPRAYRIVFAERVLRAPEALECGDWCRDLPNPGVVIPAGAPVLSVFAEGATPELAQAQLERRTLEAKQRVARWTIEERTNCTA